MNYLLHASIILAGLYCFYWLLLRNETFFRLNRWVLLGALMTAFLLPLIKIPAAWSLRTAPTVEVLKPVAKVTLEAPNGASLTAPASGNQPATPSKWEKSQATPQPATPATGSLSPSFSTWRLILIAYLGGVVIFAGAFLIQLLVILRKRRDLEFIQDGPYRIYELQDDTPPFSFGNWIFLNPSAYDFETYEQILAHEKLHVAQHHTIDKILAEIVVILLWFNPFSWLLRTAISKNLEYLTDAEMIHAGTNPTRYQLSLVKVSVPQHALNLTTNYNESFLKKRVTMMNTKKSSARSSWKYLLLFPLLAISVVSLNATLSALPENEPNLTEQEEANPNPNPNPDPNPSPNPEPAYKGPIQLEHPIKPLVKKRSFESLTPPGVPWEADLEKEYRKVIKKEISFDNLNDGREKQLAIHNITGAVQVEGYSGSTIQITVEKVIRARTEADLQDGIREVQLGIVQRDDILFLYQNSPYTYMDLEQGSFSLNNCNGRNCYDYQFALHYKVKVPYSLSLTLATINGGDIEVHEVLGKTLNVRHVSGSIYLEDVTGVAEVTTVSGHIEASFRENPVPYAYFESVSGHVEVDFQDDLNAEVQFATVSGDLKSSFPMKGRTASYDKSKYQSPVTIGAGENQITMRSVSGHIIIK